MTHFRFRWSKQGGHIHVRVFTSEHGPKTTHGKNGDLIFRPKEWDAWVNKVCAAVQAGTFDGVEIVEDDDYPVPS